jgi:hypothetical protein
MNRDDTLCGLHACMTSLVGSFLSFDIDSGKVSIERPLCLETVIAKQLDCLHLKRRSPFEEPFYRPASCDGAARKYPHGLCTEERDFF